MKLRAQDHVASYRARVKIQVSLAQSRTVLPIVLPIGEYDTGNPDFHSKEVLNVVLMNPQLNTSK